MARFDDRAALVTGAGSGIGAATAARFGAGGARVVCADVDEAAAERTATAIRDAGAEASSIRCDVSDEASAQASVAHTVDTFGGLHVLANVAGVGGFRRLEELELPDWNRIINVNLTGTYLMCRAAIAHLLDVRGTIVNVASTAGVKGQPWSAAYSASKGGVAMLTRSLAHEFAERGVRVNAVAPGGVLTPLLEQFQFPEGVDLEPVLRMAPASKEMGQPEQIAAAICWLASDEADYVDGAVLPVDGCTVA